MAKMVVAALCAVLAFGCVPPAMASEESTGTSAPDAAIARERAALQAVLANVQGGKPDGAANIVALKAILADPNFPVLSDSERHMAYLLYGASLYDARGYRDAQAPLRQATDMPQAGAIDWSIRFDDDYMLDDYPDAADALTQIARRWPQKLADYKDQAFFVVAREVLKLPSAADRAFGLLNALYAAKWKPSNAFESPDEIWLDLVRIRLERGDVDGAKAVAEDVGDPVSLLEMHADKRFDAIVAADPRHFDVMRGFSAALADMQAKRAVAPDKLAGVNVTAGLLLRMRRPDEALALIDDALARMKANAGAFGDADEQLGWMQDQRADALFALGRSEEAIAAMAEAATHLEGGQVNVSQSINVAEIYAMYDRPKDALAAVAALQFSNASEYGRMALEDARACPLFELGDTAALAPVLAYMKAHVRDGAQPFFSTMLCVGDLDSAAAEVIAELADPALRPWMLYYLQDYPPTPHASRREAAIHSAWLAVRRRPDVAAAIARVGRIESYDLKNPAY